MGNCDRKAFVDDTAYTRDGSGNVTVVGSEMENVGNLVNTPFSMKKETVIPDPLYNSIKRIIPQEFLNTDPNRFTNFYRIKKNIKCEENLIYQMKIIEKKNTGQLFCAKIITKDKILQIGESSFKILFSNEIKALTTLIHPNTEKLIKIFLLQTESSTKKGFKLIIITNYVHPHSLLEIINKRIKEKKPFTEKEIYTIAKSLLIICYKMKSINLIHRNISPENVWFIKPSNYKTLSLRNFYFSTLLSRTQTSSGVYGGLWYMAPEILRDVKYDYKVDIWSIGIIIYMLITLENPFVGCESRDAILEKMKDPAKSVFKLGEETRKLGVNPTLLHFVDTMLNDNPAHRTSIELLLEDDFIKNSKFYDSLTAKEILDFVTYPKSFLTELNYKITTDKGKMVHSLVFYIVYNLKDFFLDVEEIIQINSIYSVLDKNSDSVILTLEIEQMLKEKLLTFGKENSTRKVIIENYINLLKLILFKNEYITDFLSIQQEKISYDMFVVANVIMKLIKTKEGNYPHKLVNILFDEVDVNNNKKIDFVELVDFIKNRKSKVIFKNVENVKDSLESDDSIQINFTNMDKTMITKLITYEVIKLDKNAANVIEEMINGELSENEEESNEKEEEDQTIFENEDEKEKEELPVVEEEKNSVYEKPKEYEEEEIFT